MSAFTAVKMGRIPKIVKEQALESRQSCGSSQNSPGDPSNDANDRNSRSPEAADKNTSHYGGIVVQASSNNGGGPVQLSAQQNNTGNRYRPYGCQPELSRNAPAPLQQQSDYQYLGGHYQRSNSETDNGQRRASKWQHPTSLIHKARPAVADGQASSFNRKLDTNAASSSAFSHSAFDGAKNPTRVYSPKRMRAMADMAITGDFNENHPDLKEVGKEMSARMATAETAVAVLEPELSGGQECVPVGEFLIELIGLTLIAN